MVRHTNTWMFNIGQDNWEQCVRGPQDATIHGEENVGRPAQGIRMADHASTADLEAGDLVFGRKKEHGVAGIWEVREVAEISDDQERSLWDDAEYSAIIYCDPIQRELEEPYEEDWSEFSDEFGESIQTVTANIMGAIHNLKPGYKAKYLSELLTHEELNSQAKGRLEKELQELGMKENTVSERTQPTDLSDYWQMVKTKRELAQEFLSTPSQETFEELLNPAHFWSQLRWMYEYDIEQIFEQHTADEIAELIERAIETDSPELLTDIHRFSWAKATELLRSIEPDTYAILNKRAETGMRDLGYTPPDREAASAEEYKQFVADVHEAAERYNLRAVAEDIEEDEVPEWTTNLEVADFVFSQGFDNEIDLTEIRQRVEGDDDANVCSASSETAPYYWVNQTRNPGEIENEYLQAPADDHWYHDVGKLKDGDKIFNYTDGQVVGYSTVVESATPITKDEAQHCRVEVDLTHFDQPLEFPEIFSYLAREDVRLDKYYPINKGGINQQYLFNLSEDAGEYLLKEGISSEPPTDHGLLTHYTTTPNATVWMYSSGPSDWLTILRRGALQFWEEIKSQWRQVAEGDIILFHVKSTDDESKALPNYELGESGFIGLGVVASKRTKSERWWWNENDGLEYPYLVILQRCYVTCDVETLDRNRAVFQLDQTEIQAEVEVLSKGLIPWQTANQRSQQTTDKDLPGPGGIADISTHRTGIEAFLREVLAAGGDALRQIDFEESDRLPAMLPGSGEPKRSNSIARQLEKVGQVVFHGPPGTGKTYNATRFARWWIHQQTPRPVETRLRMVTFHPSFAYENFMEGLAADTTDGGQVTYDYEPGIFKKIYADARAAYEATAPDEPAPRYVLIIDEINRGNLSQIFGEIITQLEMDKRLGQEEQLTLEWAHSGESVTVPPNLYVIGTMNTADRSIALIDAALRRRFSFHVFPPDMDIIIEEYEQFDSRADLLTLVDESQQRFDALLARSVRAIEAMNHNIITESDLTRGKRIGHSYLLGLDTVQDILDAWRFEILPLLEEYYFGDFNRLRREVFADEPANVGVGPETITRNLFEVTTGEVADFTTAKLDSALKDMIQRHDFNQHKQ